MTRWPWLRFLVLCALRNLARSPHRTLFSLATIAGAVTALLLFRAFNQGVAVQFRDYFIRTHVGQYQLHRKGYRENKGKKPYDYPITNAADIRRALEEHFGKLALFDGRQDLIALLSVGDHSLAAKGYGMDAAEERRFFSVVQVKQGHPLSDTDERGLQLGTGLARQLGVGVGDTVTALVSTSGGSLNAYDLTVSGLFETGVQEMDEGYFQVHQALAQKLLRTGGPSEISLAFPGRDELKYQAELTRFVAERFPDIEVLHWLEIGGVVYRSGMSWLASIFGFLRAVVVLIVSLAIVNIFNVALLERTGELGTLRALGTRRGELVGMVFVESLVQAVLGGTIGLAATLVLMATVLRHGIDMPPPTGMTLPFHVDFLMPWAQAGGVLALCIGIAALAGFLPSWRIARLNITRALGANI